METFLSSSWYQVAGLRPRLRPHARMLRHVYRGERWYVIQDSLAGRTHRLTPTTFAIVARMDGSRTLDELWLAAAAELAEEAPTQDQVIRLLSQLQEADLLQSEVRPDGTELIQRRDRQRRSRIFQAVFNPLSLKVPLLDPDRFLSRSAPLVSWLFTPLGFAVWLALVLPALILAGVNWSDLTDNVSDRVLSVENVALFAIVYPAVKIMHELGHGYAAKAFGAEVHEAGVMFLVFYPVPYVDASGASAFRSRSRRIVVGAAGMMVELGLASLALYLWLAVEPGLVRTTLANVMIIAGVSTLIFNANPLLRFDGYYILADLIESPNLGPRANRHVGWLVESKLFGVRGQTPPQATPGERVWFVLYAPAAFLFRSMVTIGIALVVAAGFHFVGVALAVWSLVIGFGVPVAKSVHRLMTAPSLAPRRGRAIAITAVAVTLSGLGLALVPFPMWTTTEGVVWLPEQSQVRMRTSGFVKELLVEPDRTVTRGQPLVDAEDSVLAAEIRIGTARVDGLQAQLAAERFSDRSSAELTRHELAQAEAERDRLLDRRSRLLIRSPFEGTFALVKAEDLPGRFVKEGEVIAYVLPAEAATVRVGIGQGDIDLVRMNLRRARVMLPGDLGTKHSTEIVREVPAAQAELPSRVLSHAGGGGIPTDPRDTRGTKALERTFQLDLRMPRDIAPTPFGSRVHVRFDLDPMPLGFQAYRRLRQLFLARFDV